MNGYKRIGHLLFRLVNYFNNIKESFIHDIYILKWECRTHSHNLWLLLVLRNKWFLSFSYWVFYELFAILRSSAIIWTPLVARPLFQSSTLSESLGQAKITDKVRVILSFLIDDTLVFLFLLSESFQDSSSSCCLDIPHQCLPQPIRNAWNKPVLWKGLKQKNIRLTQLRWTPPSRSVYTVHSLSMFTHTKEKASEASAKHARVGSGCGGRSPPPTQSSHVICDNRYWHKLIFCRHGTEDWVGE